VKSKPKPAAGSPRPREWSLRKKLQRRDPVGTRLRTKVHRLFRKAFGEHAERLLFFDHQKHGSLAVEAAFLRSLRKTRANELGFHSYDWREDAAFMVALNLFPEKFTPAEIREGIDACAIHASYHIHGMTQMLDYDFDWSKNAQPKKEQPKKRKSRKSK
jgi:hypothetical protein